MVELTGIPKMKNQKLLDHINHLANIAKIDDFTQEQIDINHSASKRADAPIIILFNKNKDEATQKAQKHNCH